MAFDNLKETRVSSQLIYDGQILHVYRDQVTLPNGNPAYREVIRLVGAVGIVPVTEDGRIVVERQYRYPLDQVITEIPAGKLDSKEEDPLDAAKRELAEETGIRADEWIPMGSFMPSCAYCDEAILLYMAKGLHKGSQQLDEDEFLNVEEVALEDLVEDVMNGRIQDGKTQVAILKAARLLGL